MICPECQIDFKGGKFWRSPGNGAFRRCPNGHSFKEPKRPRGKTKEQRALDRLAKWCELVFSQNYHPEFKNGLKSALNVINHRD